MKIMIGKYDFRIPDSIESYLKKAVIDGENILIGGETGVGKTTLLEQLMQHIPENSRSVLVDEVNEKSRLRPLQGNKFMRDKVMADELGSEGISKLLIASMRLGADRTIVDEIRGAKAFDIYNIMATGDTVLTSIHSTDIEETLQNFTNQILLKNRAEVTEEVNDLLTSITDDDLEVFVDIVIHIKRSEDGSFLYISDIVEYQNREKIVIFKQNL